MSKKKYLFIFLLFFGVSVCSAEQANNVTMSNNDVNQPETKDDFEHLISDLNNGVRDARRVEIIMLGRSKDPRAVEPLIKALNNPSIKNTETQQQVIYALENIKDPRAVEPLLAHLNDDNDGIRNSIINALEKFKDYRTVGPLIDILKESQLKDDPNSQFLKERIPSALREITDQDFGMDTIKWQEWWRKFQENSQPQKAAEIARRKEQLHELGKNKDASGIPLLTEALKDVNPDIRIAASWSIANMADKRMLPELIKALEDEDYRVRGNSVWGLSLIGGDAVIAPLIVMLKDTHSQVRNNTIAALVSVGKSAVPALLNALETERLKLEERERGFALHAIVQSLGEIGDKSAVPYLYKLLEDKDGNVAIWATEALCAMGDETVILDLMKFAVQKVKDIDPHQVKDMAQKLDATNADGPTRLLTGLSFISTSGNISTGIWNMGDSIFPTLMKALKSEDSEVRLFDIGCLQHLAMEYSPYRKEIIASFIDLLRDKNHQVRKEAARALSEITDIKHKTGQDFGEDENKWRTWWQENKNEQ